MGNTLRLEIVTPDAKVCSEDVDMVTLPGVEGQLGILPGHIPLMTCMVRGELIMHRNGQDSFLFVGDGFVEITGDHVSILTELAITADSIDEAKAEEDRQLAAARMREAMSSQEIASLSAALTHILGQVRVKRRQHS